MSNKTKKEDKERVFMNNVYSFCELINFYFERYKLEDCTIQKYEFLDDKYDSITNNATWKLVNKNRYLWFIYSTDGECVGTTTYEFAFDLQLERFVQDYDMIKLKNVYDTHNQNTNIETIVMNTNTKLFWHKKTLKWVNNGEFDITQEDEKSFIYTKYMNHLLDEGMVDLWRNENENLYVLQERYGR